MKRNRSIPPIFRRWSVVTAAVILLTGGALKWNASLMPDAAPPPSPPIPFPNAFDYFRQAGQNIVDVRVFEDYERHTIQTSIEDYHCAHVISKTVMRPLTLTERNQIAARNAVAVQLIKQALTCKYQAPVPISFDDRIPDVANDGRLARMLSYTGQTYAMQGRWNQAMSAYIDAIQLGTDVTHKQFYVGMRCEDVGRHHSQLALNHLTDVACRADAARLEAIDERAPSFYQSSLSQKLKWERCLATLFRKPKWRNWFFEHFDYIDSNPPIMPDQLKLYEDIGSLYVDSPRAFYDTYNSYADDLDASIARPWPEVRKSALPILPNEIGIAEFAWGTFYVTRLYSQNECLALNRLLELQLALRAYQWEQGQYPSSLSTLAPRYLKRIPLDPFSRAEPFIYHPANKHYLLYSIGPDALDDGGKPIERDTIDPDDRYKLSMDSYIAQGDIVAGVND